MKKKNRTIIPSRILPKNSFRDTVDGKRVWIINHKTYASKREYFDSLQAKANDKSSGHAEEIEEFEEGAGWSTPIPAPVAVTE